MIFISYRRVDTQPWASHLYDELGRRFGRGQVFMDVRDGIRGGDDFAAVLRRSLDSCRVLLAVIGPQWTTVQREDGRPRLVCDDDWVRNEVATALTRGVLVVPVLFGRAALPGEDELPPDLRPLRERQHRLVRDESWDNDFTELVKDLAAAVPLDDVGNASAGLGGLRQLMQSQPAVADAVGRSREVIDITYRQLARLDAHKTVHDGLHVIEHECLWPLQEGSAATRLRPFKIKLATATQRIRERLSDQHIPQGLAQDIDEQLEHAALALQAAVDKPGPDTLATAVAELTLLLSGLPSRLDAGISEAATELRLDRLLELMASVRQGVLARGADAELAPFVDGIAALERLRSELQTRVVEHAQLQRLDAKLRAVCTGNTPAAALAAEWARTKLIRSRLQPPFSAPLQGVLDDLAALEGEIEAALAQPGEGADLLRDYFHSVASVFRDVDTELKEFCSRLADVGQPLRTVLQMV